MKNYANTYFWFWECQNVKSPVTLWLIDSERFSLSNFMFNESPSIQFVIYSLFIEIVIVSDANLNFHKIWIFYKNYIFNIY